MLHWLLLPFFSVLHRQVREIVLNAMGAKSKTLIKKVALWNDVERSVDTMINDSLREFIQDTAAYRPVQDEWEKASNDPRKGFSVPVEDLKGLIVCSAVKSGRKKSNRSWIPGSRLRALA